MFNNSWHPNPGRDPLGMPQVIRSVPTEWIPATPKSAHTFSPRAFIINKGEDSNESPLWVIRTEYNGDLIPGKYDTRSETATIPYGGNEVIVQNFEVLCARVFRWLPAEDGNVPEGAFPAGKNKNGEMLYVCKVDHESGCIPGKLQPSSGCAHITYNGVEIPFKQYKVLSYVYECLAKYYAYLHP